MLHLKAMICLCHVDVFPWPLTGKAFQLIPGLIKQGVDMGEKFHSFLTSVLVSDMCESRRQTSGELGHLLMISQNQTFAITQEKAH